MDAIEVRAVKKHFGSVKALDGVSLGVKKGEIFGLLGPNGAGKTTLLRILTGQLVPDSGGISVNGKTSKDPIGLRSAVGIVPEAETPPTFLTAQEVLQLICRIRKMASIEKRVDSWMGFLGLEEQRDILCRDLSKGQRQKVMLASAFIHEPPILFLDEPFINLDPIYQRKIRRYILSLLERKVTIFMCTHILDMAERMCSRVALINRGKIVVRGDVSKIRRKEGLEELFIRMAGEG